MKASSVWQRWCDLRGALCAAAILCRVAFALRRLAFPDLLHRLRLRQPLPAASSDCIARALTDVRRAHRLLPLQPNCLLDSLTAAVLLQRQGYSAPLAIGVKKETSGQVLAHAWLGADTAPASQEFSLLYRVPQGSTGFQPVLFPSQSPSAAKLAPPAEPAP